MAVVACRPVCIVEGPVSGGVGMRLAGNEEDGVGVVR